MDLLGFVDEYCYEYYSYLDSSTVIMDPEFFTERSYQLWASSEILNRIRDIGDDDILDEIDFIIAEWDDFSTRGERAIMFSIGRDVALDIRDAIKKEVRKHAKAFGL